ncbi:MAG: N-acyl amino acid synthase FeeM domain-containing protein [Rubrivivax sp.]
MSVCTLGFTLRPVASHADLLEACSVRAQAYGHHMPELGQRLAEPDALDLAEGTAVFLCRDKASGQVTGTMRIQTSQFGALMMERSLALPRWLGAASRAEITRLAVRVGADPLTKLCLMKASYLFCMAQQVRWMVIGARNEALMRNYRRLGFMDALGGDRQVPLAHTGGLPHHIMAFDVSAAQGAWAEARHPLYDFMVDTLHDDLQIGPFRPAQRPMPARSLLAAAG